MEACTLSALAEEIIAIFLSGMEEKKKKNHKYKKVASVQLLLDLQVG